MRLSADAEILSGKAASKRIFCSSRQYRVTETKRNGF